MRGMVVDEDGGAGMVRLHCSRRRTGLSCSCPVSTSTSKQLGQGRGRGRKLLHSQEEEEEDPSALFRMLHTLEEEERRKKKEERRRRRRRRNYSCETKLKKRFSPSYDLNELVKLVKRHSHVNPSLKKDSHPHMVSMSLLS